MSNQFKTREMCDLVAAKLAEHDWHFERREFEDGECAIDTDITSQSQLLRKYEIRMLFRRRAMQTIYYIPVMAPERVRGEMSEYLMHANSCTLHGKFVMDFGDGEIRYEKATSLAEVEADVDSVLTRALDMLKATVDQYVTGLIAVAMGKLASDAFASVVKAMNVPPQPPPLLPPVGNVEDLAEEFEAGQQKKQKGE